MGYKTYLRIIIRIIALVYSVQLISGTEWMGSFISNPITAAIAGLIVCVAEILIIKNFLGDQSGLLQAPFGGKKILHALLAFLLVFTFTALCVENLDQHKKLTGTEDLPVYLLIFFINLLPNALTEEWIFRFFPTVIAKYKSTVNAVLFYVCVTIIFMLTHLPKFYINGHIADLGNVFTAGIAFFVIYLLTRNLPFVALIHAFTNMAWFAHSSSSNWLFLYVSVVVVSLFWGMGNFLLRRQMHETR